MRERPSRAAIFSIRTVATSFIRKLMASSRQMSIGISPVIMSRKILPAAWNRWIKPSARETRNMAASCTQCDGAWLWFGVHKQLSCQVSLVNASCHSQRRSLCPGVVGCCHGSYQKLFSRFNSDKSCNS